MNNFKIILHKQTPKVEENIDCKNFSDSNNYNKLLEFLNFFSELDGALGLACNQVEYKGILFDKMAFAMRMKDRIELIINPKITSVFGFKIQQKEGCLSWPNKTILAGRYTGIKVSYCDLFGNEYNTKFTGLYAQIFQHEMDHLNGIEEIII